MGSVTRRKYFFLKYFGIYDHKITIINFFQKIEDFVKVARYSHTAHRPKIQSVSCRSWSIFFASFSSNQAPKELEYIVWLDLPAKQDKGMI